MSRPRRSPALPSPVEGEAGSIADRLSSPSVEVPEGLLRAIEGDGVEVVRKEAALIEASRDWWPVSIGWAAQGLVPRRPGAVVCPTSTEQVSKVLSRCNKAGVPVTPSGGRSGVCGGAVPVHGGIALDLTPLSGLEAVDEASLTVDVHAGTFGPDLEAGLAACGAGYTAGHRPQSMDLSTVGGWLACRGAGQYSTRYGKIEDITVGLVAVLADGTVVDTRHEAPRSATGPSLTQLFLGSEGALGVITLARLRIRPRPAGQARRAFGFASFDQGLDACRRMLRRGATPAVLRLYDAAESTRNFEETSSCVLIVLDEADPGLVDTTMRIVDEEVDLDRSSGAVTLDQGLVARWLTHRNDVSALAPLWQSGIVVDTAEVAGPWSVLPTLAREVPDALRSIEGTLVASVHQSHAYADGACLYFTFAGRAGDGPSDPADADPRDLSPAESYYRAAWDAVSETVVRHGAAISHHHGIGVNRGRFLPDALGTGLGVLEKIKAALDPQGILNPGTLGLPSPFGEVSWP